MKAITCMMPWQLGPMWFWGSNLRLIFTKFYRRSNVDLTLIRPPFFLMLIVSCAFSNCLKYAMGGAPNVDIDISIYIRDCGKTPEKGYVKNNLLTDFDPEAFPPAF